MFLCVCFFGTKLHQELWKNHTSSRWTSNQRNIRDKSVDDRCDRLQGNNLNCVSRLALKYTWNTSKSGKTRRKKPRVSVGSEISVKCWQICRKTYLFGWMRKGAGARPAKWLMRKQGPRESVILLKMRKTRQEGVSPVFSVFYLLYPTPLNPHPRLRLDFQWTPTQQHEFDARNKLEKRERTWNLKRAEQMRNRLSIKM